ncbi:MAG TPA: ELWxxDGT repeat protein [Pirellulales bacterium]|nr:ELWxxDGT repeat protein [Pirellulales bacterium]
MRGKTSSMHRPLHARTAKKLRPASCVRLGELLERRDLLSATGFTASILAQINGAPASSDPHDIVVVGNEAFFAATDQGHGTELWKSDGTAAGTVLVKDIVPGTASSNPENLTNVNGTLFFTVGNSLWKSDGTAGGTVELQQFSLPLLSVGIGNLTPCQSSVFFTVSDRLHEQLWKSDGTPGGTVELQQFSLVGLTDPIGNLTVSRSNVFFTVNSAQSIFDQPDLQLWTSNGTAGGTVALEQSPSGFPASGFTDVNGTLYFAENSQLWKSDGTAAGTAVVASMWNSLGDLTNIGGTLYFAAYDSAVGHVLATWNGSAITYLGTFPDNPQQLTDVAGTIYFSVGGNTLWKSDGTVNGAVQIPESFPGLGLDNADGTLFFESEVNGPFSNTFIDQALWTLDPSGAPLNIVPSSLTNNFNALPTAFDGSFFFVFNNRIWQTDGTIAGTQMTSSVAQLLGGSTVSTVANGSMLFSATDGTHGTQLWGIAAGTDVPAVVKTINPGSQGIGIIDSVGIFTSVNGTVYFDGGGGIWHTDGTVADTLLYPNANASYGMWNVDGHFVFAPFDQQNGYRLATIDATMGAIQNLATLDTNPANMTAVGSTWYFTVGSQLWRTDGTVSGTSNVTPSGLAGTLQNLTSFESALYFIINDASTGNNDPQLWTSDGSTSGTKLVADFGAPSASLTAGLTNAGGISLFVTVGFPATVWTSDGTTSGTVKLAVVGGAGEAAKSFAAVSGGYVFVADDAQKGNALWFTDGTAEGTKMIADINPNNQAVTPPNFISVNGTVLFTADDGVHGTELWTTDGTATGTHLFLDINPGAAGSDPANFTEANGEWFLTADDGTHGIQLWTTDGTVAGTKPLETVNATEAYGGFDPSSLTAIGNQLFFTANDGVHGDEPWVSDGTVAGTSMAVDFDSGDGGSGASNYAVLANNRVFMTADDGIDGIEPAALSPIVPLVLTSGPIVTATEGTGFSGEVASFTSGDPADTTANFTATVLWGDGSSSSGTVSAASGGGFQVTGSHTYAEAGTNLPLSILVVDTDGSTATASGAANVADAPLTASAVAVSATAGATFSGHVATFTDANPLATADDFTASITWGDGQSSAGTVVAAVGGGYVVTGTHLYAEVANGLAVNVSILDVGGAAASAQDVANVSDAPILPMPAAITSTEGATFNGTVATFTDGNTLTTPADFTATIAWGDGGSSAGTVTAGDGGGFVVTGAHVYADAATGVPLKVVITDANGGNATADGTANIADASLTAAGATIAVTEGATFAGSVATFTDANPFGAVNEFTGTIDWGDGQMSAGVVATVAAGGFAVSGSHVYAEAGQYLTSVTIDDVGGSTATADGTANVADASLTATGATIAAGLNATFSGKVATFTDANPLGVAADFTATIDWGDGSGTTAGSVSAAAGGGFVVTGSHEYTALANDLPLSVLITDKGGATATTSGAATVTVAAITATGQNVSATEGAGFAATVATFTYSGPAAAASDFTATIDWGDGASAAAGSISGTSAAGFTVSGTHTYAVAAADLPITVVIDGPKGAVATTEGAAVVADAPLAATAVAVALLPGAPLANAVLATFTDTGGAEPVGDYSATIDWGDGTTGAGTVVATAGGGFQVTGSHTYSASTTNEQITVTIRDNVGGAHTQVTTQVSVGDANAQYVAAVFLDVLGRPVDAAGLAYWDHLLDTGTAVASVAAAIANSPEYYANIVIMPDYVKLLGRAPDAAGLAYWVAQMDGSSGNVTDQQLEADLVSAGGTTGEFYTDAGGTNTDWIDAVYEKLLGRAADVAGEMYWNGLLNMGETLGLVAQGIAGSRENDTQLINDDYMQYLGRAADPGGLAYWLQQFADGATNEDVIAGFTGADEYYNKHTS